MKIKTLILLLLFLLTISIRAQDQTANIRKAAAEFNKGNYISSSLICREALSNSEDYRLYLILADAQGALGMSAEAESSYQKASYIALGAGDLGLALIYADRNDPEKLVFYLEKHLRSPFKKSESELMLNQHFSSFQTTDEWKNLWKRSWYTGLEKGLEEADYLVNNGRLEELVSLQNRLIPVYRDEAAMIYLEGLVMITTGDNKSGLEKIRLALDEGYNKPDAYLNFIDVLIKERRFTEAVNISENASDLFPAESEFLLKLAESNRLAGDRDRAAEIAEAYLDLYPTSEDGLSLAGKILREKGSYSDALKYFSRSIELFPGNADHYIDRADVYSLTKTWQYAIYDYSMALDLKPDDADAYYRKGTALLNTGKLEDACRDFRMALKYGNNRAASEINKHCIR